MGSCSNKSANHPQGPIKTITIARVTPAHESEQHEEAKASTRAGEILRLESNKENGRKTRKNLTVLTTNNDEFELPKDMSMEKSIRIPVYEEKPEQGSMYVMKEPILIRGQPSTEKQTNFEEKVTLVEGDNVKRDFLLEQGMWVCCKKA